MYDPENRVNTSTPALISLRAQAFRLIRAKSTPGQHLVNGQHPTTNTVGISRDLRAAHGGTMRRRFFLAPVATRGRPALKYAVAFRHYGLPGVSPDRNEPEGTMMKMTGLAFLVAGLLNGSADVAAQRPSTGYGLGYGLAAPLDVVPYSGLAQVPPNGCVWENVIYSSGAVIPQGYASLPIYFQCDHGTWIRISPADAILGPAVPETPDGYPRRPH